MHEISVQNRESLGRPLSLNVYINKTVRSRTIRLLWQ